MLSTAAAEKERRIRDLYEAHGDRLFRAALRLGSGRRAFAEDVVQDVFERLLLTWDRLQETDDLGGWLYRVTMNSSLTKLRRESFRKSPLVQAFLGAAAPESPSADIGARLSASQREALDALALLPARERVAFSMVHIDEAPLADVAAALACSTSYAWKLAQKGALKLEQHGWRAGVTRAALFAEVRA